jgi:hypothetical protein
MTNPKKSKAFIITFILILLLLLVGYWLYSKKDTILSTNGLNLGRIFEPLVGSLDMKDVGVIGDPKDNIFDKIANTAGGVFGSIFNKNNKNKDNEYDYEYEYDPNNNIYNFPVVNITASPSSVEVGGSSVISWTSTNSVSCDAGNGTEARTSGSFDTGPLNNSRSFSISCTGENGTISNSIIVRIANREIDPFKFPMVTTRANPSPINPGESSTISWESNNTDSCNSGAGNPTTTSGNFSTGPLNETKAYTIICTGKDGSTGRNVFVIVKNYGNFDPIDGDGAACSNGKDDDNDKLVDSFNPQCHVGGDLAKAYVPTHYSELINPPDPSGLSICNDDVDNDVDGKTDKLDPECHSDGDIYNTYSYVSTWTSESVRPSPACNNKNDDDKDSKIDIEDPECHTDGNANNVSSYSLNHFSESVRIVISQCGDGIDNDKKEGTDSEDESCHTDFNKDNTLSYDKNIKNEGRVKISAQCGDGLNNDNKEGADYKDKDCHTDLNINNWESYYPDIYTEGGVLPTPGEECANGAINYPICDDTGSNFCSQNKITKELEKDKAANDKEQVRSLQLILNKLVSLSLGTTYLKTSDVDGDFGEKTRLAVETFQKDNGLNFAIKQGSVDKETMDLLNAKCEQFLNGGGEKCTNGAVNPTLCTIDVNGKCLNKAVNPPICTINSDGKCLNGAINPPTCNVQPTIEVNKCAIFDQYPLEFNDDEKAQLAELLRKFYLLAPTLKTEDDLNLVYSEIERYKELIAQTKELTKQCYLESAAKQDWLFHNANDSFCSRNEEYCVGAYEFNNNYTGPTKRFGNPWFNQNSVGSYVDETKYSTPNMNTDANYLLKIHGNDKISPLLTKYPPVQMNRCFGLNWDFPTDKDYNASWQDFIPIWGTIRSINAIACNQAENPNAINSIKYDLNAVILDRLHEFEILLNIW